MIREIHYREKAEANAQILKTVKKIYLNYIDTLKSEPMQKAAMEYSLAKVNIYCKLKRTQYLHLNMLESLLLQRDNLIDLGDFYGLVNQFPDATPYDLYSTYINRIHGFDQFYDIEDKIQRKYSLLIKFTNDAGLIEKFRDLYIKLFCMNEACAISMITQLQKEKSGS